MKKAAMQEASSENAPTNPGDILPSEELLGDMYMELSRIEEAYAAYQLSLKRSPGRYNSLYGAGKTAYEMGDEDGAREYFTQLIENTKGASSSRGSLSDARTILEKLGEK